VREIALFGHAMGGLVARAACHYGSGRAWTRYVRHVIMLGAPHGGAPLEQLTAAAGGILARLPETRPVARAIEQRSAGIKDLRYGYVVDEDWADGDRSAPPREIPFLEGAKHYFVSSGDLFVTRRSAWARRAREPVRFPAEHYAHIDGVSHFDLLNHPAVYAQIHWWLCSRRALPAPAGGVGRGQRP
jgi:pimeloyl-ACP methyl ester carboxylesterase